MLPVANQPILFYSIQSLARAGVRDIAIVLGPVQEGIREAIGDGKVFGVHITYINQGEPKGLAHAVICAREFLAQDPFIMFLGDNLLQEGVEGFIESFQPGKVDAVVGVTPVSHPEHYGVAEIEGARLVSIEEKPPQPRSNLALIGVYLFGPSIHSVVASLKPSKRGELEITEAIWKLHCKRNRVAVRRISGWWKDTGQPDDILEANDLVLRTKPFSEFHIDGVVQKGARVDGPVTLETGSVVKAGAQVVGPIIIGPNVVIENGSIVGPWCAIGGHVRIDRATVRQSIVLSDASIEGVTLERSLIGRNVRIEASAQLTRPISAIVGDSSKVILP
jgi:glucose-1-phosphate thymidylyltransferase